MNLATTLTLLLTVIFGIPAYLALRKERSSLIFLEEDNIDLYNRILTKFGSIKINYKEKEIKKGLFLLRGLLLSIGTKDILKESIKKGVNLKLDPNGEWKEAKIISSTSDMNLNLRINKNELLLDADLIKKGDYVYFEALGEASKNDYNVNHRIVNVGSIKVNQLNSYTNSIISMFYLVTIFLLMAFIGACMWYEINPFAIKSSNITPIYYDSKLKEISKDSLSKKDSSSKKVTYRFQKDSTGNLVLQDTSIYYKRMNELVGPFVRKARDSIRLHNNRVDFMIDRTTQYIDGPNQIKVKFKIARDISLIDIYVLIFLLAISYQLIDLIMKLIRKRKIKKIIDYIEMKQPA